MEKKDILHACLASIERRKDRNIIVKFHVNGETKAEYDLSVFCSADMKTPQQWLNLCFFSYEMGEFGNGEFGLKVEPIKKINPK